MSASLNRLERPLELRRYADGSAGWFAAAAAEPPPDRPEAVERVLEELAVEDDAAREGDPHADLRGGRVGWNEPVAEPLSDRHGDPPADPPTRYPVP
jgi:hypothetical protein